jgi:hypothetical protein
MLVPVAPLHGWCDTPGGAPTKIGEVLTSLRATAITVAVAGLIVWAGSCSTAPIVWTSMRHNSWRAGSRSPTLRSPAGLRLGPRARPRAVWPRVRDPDASGDDHIRVRPQHRAMPDAEDRDQNNGAKVVAAFHFADGKWSTDLHHAASCSDSSTGDANSHWEYVMPRHPKNP